MPIQGDTAFRYGKPEQRVKAVNFDVCSEPPNKLVTIATSLGLLLNLSQLDYPHTSVYQR